MSKIRNHNYNNLINLVDLFMLIYLKTMYKKPTKNYEKLTELN